MVIDTLKNDEFNTNGFYLLVLNDFLSSVLFSICANVLITFLTKCYRFEDETTVYRINVNFLCCVCDKGIEGVVVYFIVHLHFILQLVLVVEVCFYMKAAYVLSESIFGFDACDKLEYIDL